MVPTSQARSPSVGDPEGRNAHVTAREAQRSLEKPRLVEGALDDVGPNRLGVGRTALYDPKNVRVRG